MEPPTLHELSKLSDKSGFKLSLKELTTLTELSKESFKSMQWVHDAEEYLPEVKYLAEHVYKPKPIENKFNAWYYKCTLTGEGTGILSNKTVVIKDSICVAGVPMMNGSRLLEGFIPSVNATVVDRVLDAGCIIHGKGTTTDLCLAGSSHPVATGPVLNPCNSIHSAGGSSAGCAVLVSNGEVDMAIGGDQGGSIRIPASNCGIVGLKPTFGLVPYTGAIPIETTVDHLGPMARTVRDCAVLLQVDTAAEQTFRLGVLKEAFDMSQPEVNDICKRTIASLQGHFSQIDNVSIPLHNQGPAIRAGITFPGLENQLVNGCGLVLLTFRFGTGSSGLLNTGVSQALYYGFKSRPDMINIVAKYCILMGKYTNTKYGMMNYAKAHGLALQLRREYDKALNDYDVLIMPTLTKPPCLLPNVNTTLTGYVRTSMDMNGNVCVFNVTHHPAITINAGFSAEGLPIGLQIVGRHWQDDTVLAVAAIIENILEPNSRKM